jgi:hypothetical protein
LIPLQTSVVEDYSSVRWRGQQAEYSTDERQIMASLTVREQAFVHTLKAYTDGQISSACDLVPTSGAVQAEVQTVAQPVTSGDVQGQLIPLTVYTDPEEIEFGHPKKKRPVYALVWTWRQHRVYKTKAKATRAARAWKLWHERSGWKVVNIVGTVGYIARKGDGRESIVLHEYDRETNERLR